MTGLRRLSLTSTQNLPFLYPPSPFESILNFCAAYTQHFLFVLGHRMAYQHETNTRRKRTSFSTCVPSTKARGTVESLRKITQTFVAFSKNGFCVYYLIFILDCHTYVHMYVHVVAYVYIHMCAQSFHQDKFQTGNLTNVFFA